MFVACPPKPTCRSVASSTVRYKAISKNIKMVATVQKPAPHFEGQAVVAGGQFKKVSLSDFKGKWVILFFYPLDFTFVCPTEILAFNDSLKEFQSLNAEVVAVSTDSEYSHLAWYCSVLDLCCNSFIHLCAGSIRHANKVDWAVI